MPGIKASLEADNDDIEVFYYGEWDVMGVLWGDMALAGLSLLVVAVVLILRLALFASPGGSVQNLHHPLAMFVWSVIFGVPTVSNLIFVGVFVIVGIGADDIFVFMDAFRQSKHELRTFRIAELDFGGPTGSCSDAGHECDDARPLPSQPCCPCGTWSISPSSMRVWWPWTTCSSSRFRLCGDYRRPLRSDVEALRKQGRSVGATMGHRLCPKTRREALLGTLLVDRLPT